MPTITNSVALWVMGVVVFFLINETLQWSWIVARHAEWMRKNDSFLICKNINFRMTCIAGVMTSILAGGVGCYLVFSLAKHWPDFFYDALATSGFMLGAIHFYVILARCTELPRELWPVPSRLISIYIVPFLRKIPL